TAKKENPAMLFTNWLRRIGAGLRNQRFGRQASGRTKSTRPCRPCRPSLEILEDRTVLSTIVWTNRGLASDNFASTFGGNRELARNVVDAALLSWQRVIGDFQQIGDRNRID